MCAVAGTKELTVAEQAEWNRITLAMDDAVEKEHRICAVCLTGVPRGSYTDHMETIHGYETLTIYAQDSQENLDGTD